MECHVTKACKHNILYANLFIFDVMHCIVLRSDYSMEWPSNTTVVFILYCSWSAIGYMFGPSCGHLQAVCFLKDVNVIEQYVHVGIDIMVCILTYF